MRPLDEKETTEVLEKLHKFVGSNLRQLIERPAHEGPGSEPGGYCLRLHRQRVYYVSEALVRRATNVGKEHLAGLGTCLGKFTKSGKFQLTITCLDLLAAHAKHKIWIKPSAEQLFLYGNHVLKSGLGRITDNTPRYEGVVIFSMSDVPLGSAWLPSPHRIAGSCSRTTFWLYGRLTSGSISAQRMSCSVHHSRSSKFQSFLCQYRHQLGPSQWLCATAIAPVLAPDMAAN